MVKWGLTLKGQRGATRASSCPGPCRSWDRWCLLTPAVDITCLTAVVWEGLPPVHLWLEGGKPILCLLLRAWICPRKQRPLKRTGWCVGFFLDCSPGGGGGHWEKKEQGKTAGKKTGTFLALWDLKQYFPLFGHFCFPLVSFALISLKSMLLFT